MKTNQVMTRKMGIFDVHQRTKDGYFEAGSLIRQWNDQDGVSRRKISEFLESPKTKEFINALVDDISHSRKADNGDNQAVIRIKGRMTKNGRIPDRWYMHPYLFIKFAMWINPRFELQVIKFVYDELIKNRHLAGDNYNILSSAIAKLPDADYRQVAIAMQWIVFNRTGKELRQTATQEQLREIYELEHSLAFSINMGFVKTNEQLIMAMRKMYSDKYRKF